MVLFGRYLQAGPVTLRMTGKYLGTQKTFTQRFELKSSSFADAHIPRLWAARKIAYLVDAIRQAGADGMTTVEPGDIVVTGAVGGGPGHVAIVGARRNTLWHAVSGPGFHQTGWALLSGQVLWAVYRIEDKHRWTN